MDLASVIVLVVVAGLAVLAVRHNLKRKGCCACGCAGCRKSCQCGK